MTDRQLDLLRAIRRYQRKHGHTPVMAELAKKLKDRESSVEIDVGDLVMDKLVKKDGASIVVLVSDEVLFGGDTDAR